MSKKFYQIDEFFPAAGDQRFSLSAESPLDQVTYNIFTADDFTDAAIYDYGERKCLFPETNDPLSAFYSRFARWKAQRGADIAAAFGALKMEYNPIENYSSTETKTGTDTALKTPNEWVKTETQTPNNWQRSEVQTPASWQEQNTKSFTNYKETETQKPTGWKKKTKSTEPLSPSEDFNKVVPFNGDTLETVSGTLHFINDTEEQEGTFDTELSKTGTETDTKTTSGSYTTTDTQSGTFTTTEGQAGTFEDKMTYNTVLTRKGNIGVTTSQQMARSEWFDLRRNQFVKEVIKEFFNNVSVYC